MELRIDSHLNLGVFPTSKHSDTVIESTVGEMAAYIVENTLSHAVILYPRDRYDMLLEVSKEVPNVKIYGLQVVMGTCFEDATLPSKLSLDVTKKTCSFTHGNLCYGIKLAPLRGWWDWTGEADSVNIQPGLNYAENKPFICNNLLDKLPVSSIVSMHMQGNYSYYGAANPDMLAVFATAYPDLKFIANHAGDYCNAGFSSRPSAYKGKKEAPYGPVGRYLHSLSTIKSAVIYANGLHNVLLESSLHAPHKAAELSVCNHWAIGSDYPFLKSVITFEQQQNRFIRSLGAERVAQMHKDALYFFETPARKLLKEHIAKW